MKKHSFSLQIIAVCFILALASWASCYFFYKVFNSENLQFASIQNEISSETANQGQRASMKALAAATAPASAEIESKVLQDDGFVSFVDSIEQIGKQEDVTLTDTLNTAADSDPAGDTQYLVVQIKMEGKWDAVVRTISLIESMPYLSNVDDLSLNKDLSSGKSESWGAEMTLDAIEVKQ